MGLAILQIILLTSIAWSDFDGRNKVTIVHIPDGRVAYKFRVRVSKVDFSPDGKYLGALTSSMELNGPEAIRLWRAGDGRSVDKFPCGGRRFDSIAFSRDGKILAAAGDGISVLNIAENKPDQAISPPEQADERYYGSRIIGFTPEGRLFTSDESHDPSTNRTRIVIWNTANSSAVGQLDLKWRKVPDRNCSYQPGICLSPDGALIAGVRTSSDDWEKPDNAYVWGASNGRLVCKIPRDKSSGLGTHLAFSPDSKMLAVADKSVKIWSIPDASLRSELGKVSGGDNTEMQSVGFSKDGKRLAAASMHQVQVWNVSNGMPLYTYSLERGNLSDNIEYASISPDGQFIAILSSRGN
jgi:WD40 repeat protein